jgi:hypothetical protein
LAIASRLLIDKKASFLESKMYSEDRGMVTLLKDIPEKSIQTESSVEETQSQGTAGSGASPSSKDKDAKKEKQETLPSFSTMTVKTIPSLIVAVSHQAKAQLYPFAIRVQSFWKRYLLHCQSLTNTLLRAQYIDNTKIFGEKLSKRMLRQTTEAMDSAKTAVSSLVKGNKKNDDD